MRLIVAFLLYWMMICYGFAQVKVHRSLIAPLRPVEGTWWLDMKSKEMRQFKHGEWKPSLFTKGVRNCEICNDLIIGHYASDDTEIISSNGNYVGISWEIPRCVDNVLLIGTRGWQYVVDNRADLFIFQRYLTKCCAGSDQLFPLQLQGQECFVAALALEAYFPVDTTLNYVCWGVINTKGEWLIAPQYDGPFSFEGGYANVIYYGKERRINEKGEFVD